MLEAGVKAPEFKLQDKDGNLVSLSDFKNKKIVLYFYPRDNTPGCTKQACSFRDNYEEFKSKDVVVIGISKDLIQTLPKSMTYHLYYYQIQSLKL